jgi:predicted nucleic acid-binding protein
VSFRVIPDVEIWIRAFSRRHPEPRIVHRLGQLITRRSVLMPGQIRQGVLARARDARHFTRLQEVLGAFPDVGASEADHVEAGRLMQRLLSVRVPITAAQAALWTVAARHGARVWTTDREFTALSAHGAPVELSAGDERR